MTDRLQYGTTAKVLHWLVAALLLVQYPIGWLMPDIHRGMKPGAAMTFHVSFGIVILILIVLRFAWRLSHPVAPESSLPRWQRLGSEAVHWLLYGLVLATTVTGWLFASFRGWSISLFYLMPLPMLTSENATAGKAFDGLHQAMEWSLLVVIGIHMAMAMVHLFIYRDRIMQRMLPGQVAARAESRVQPDPRDDEKGRTMSKDIDELMSLNRDYVASVQNCDVKRFDEILADDFYCSNPDKSLVDRSGFLNQTAIPLTIRNLEAHDVNIRLMGDFAIIHAATRYTMPDGKPGSGRYTDCWARRNGRWLAVSAHVSR